MDGAEAIAIIILIVAILTLLYYYLHNNPTYLQSLRSHIPVNSDASINDFFKAGSNEDVNVFDDEEKEGMGKKIKVKLSDIDMSSFNTDAFSKKIDAFLDHKSDELIKEWSLATTDDLADLESKFNDTTSRVDSLDEEFKKFKADSEEFKKNTESKLADIDKRIEELENK